MLGRFIQVIIFMIQAAKNIKDATKVNQLEEKEVREEEELEEVEREDPENRHCTEINDLRGELDTVAAGGEKAASVEVITEPSKSSYSVGETNNTIATLSESADGDTAVGEPENSDTAMEELKDSSVTATDGSTETVDKMVAAVLDENQGDVEGEDSVLLSKDSPILHGLCYSRLKLLLYRGSFVLVGALLLLGGGVASYYHPQGEFYDLTNCTNVTAGNITMGNMTIGNMTLYLF